MKSSNEYAQAFGQLYAKVPKAVFAAVAFSYAGFAIGDEAKTEEEQVERFLEEWRILHENGIVPQKPPVAHKRYTEHAETRFQKAQGGQ